MSCLQDSGGSAGTVKVPSPLGFLLASPFLQKLREMIQEPGVQMLPGPRSHCCFFQCSVFFSVSVMAPFGCRKWQLCSHGSLPALPVQTKMETLSFTAFSDVTNLGITAAFSFSSLFSDITNFVLN